MMLYIELHFLSLLTPFLFYLNSELSLPHHIRILDSVTEFKTALKIQIPSHYL